MSSLLRLTFIAGFLFIYLPLYSQQEIPPPPMEWNKISKADLEMKSYPTDTNASALILCDYGETRMNGNADLEFRRHLRVKIFNEKGYEWATQVLYLYYDSRNNSESIKNIKGITYALNADGDVEEKEFDDDDVFKETWEKNDKYTRYKFTLPGLTPGCIIELQYKIIANNPFLIRGWKFQYSEPCLWSEYRIIAPANFGFTGVTNGYEKFTINDFFQTKITINGALQSLFGLNPILVNVNRMVLKNARALRDEPFITTIDDYYNKVDMQFFGYSVNGPVKKFYDTWEDFAKKINDWDNFGDRLDNTSTVDDRVKAITSGLTSPENKLRAIYQWVSSSIVFSKQKRFTAKLDGEKVLETKSGNSADINFLFMSMLKSAGIDCHPVIASTRDNGKVQDLYPIVDQFNYVLAQVKIDGKTYYIDATDPFRPMNMLPSYLLGVKGFIVLSESGEWIVLQSPQKSYSAAMGILALHEDGSATGSIEGKFRDYANIDVRHDIQSKSNEEIVKENFGTEKSGLTVDSVTVTGKDSIETSLIVKAFVTSPAFAQVSDSLMYVNPHAISRWKDNPFKSTERNFPINYNYPREYSSVVNLTFPSTYEIKEGLKNKLLNIENSVRYRRQFSSDDSTIHVITKFEILEKEIPARLYQQLKELYSLMLSLESEQIVLQKKPLPPQPEPLPQPTAPKKKSKASKNKIKK
jgi:hypothetical protein